MEHQDLSFVEMTNCKLAMKDAEKGAGQLNNFFHASTELMQLMARACGHDHLNKFCSDDLATVDREMAHLTGIAYAGVSLD